MTSHDFLSWFDELIWDDPTVSLESGNLGGSIDSFGH
jgi:hypothetical protein